MTIEICYNWRNEEIQNNNMLVWLLEHTSCVRGTHPFLWPYGGAVLLLITGIIYKIQYPLKYQYMSLCNLWMWWLPEKRTISTRSYLYISTTKKLSRYLYLLYKNQHFHKLFINVSVFPKYKIPVNRYAAPLQCVGMCLMLIEIFNLQTKRFHTCIWALCCRSSSSLSKTCWLGAGKILKWWKFKHRSGIGVLDLKNYSTFGLPHENQNFRIKTHKQTTLIGVIS